MFVNLAMLGMQTSRNYAHTIILKKKDKGKTELFFFEIIHVNTEKSFVVYSTVTKMYAKKIAVSVRIDIFAGDVLEIYSSSKTSTPEHKITELRFSYLNNTCFLLSNHTPKCLKMEVVLGCFLSQEHRHKRNFFLSLQRYIKLLDNEMNDSYEKSENVIDEIKTPFMFYINTLMSRLG